MNCFTTYILLALFSVAYANSNNNTDWMQYLPEDCGRTRYDNKTTRIIHGEEARLGEFPFMGRLGRYEKGSIFFFCGAVLVNRFYVISAAHCEELTDIVRFGEHDGRTPIDCRDGECAPAHQDIKVKDCFIQNYCRGSKINDIMVVELEEPVTFNEFVQPACIPRDPAAYEDLPGTYFTLVGWGRTSPSGQQSKYLQHIRLEVQNDTTCRVLFEDYVAKANICFKTSDKGENACKGDSGGPAIKTMEVDGVKRAYAFAVSSFTGNFCERGAGYSNILFYSDFISTAIKKG